MKLLLFDSLAHAKERSAALLQNNEGPSTVTHYLLPWKYNSITQQYALQVPEEYESFLSSAEKEDLIEDNWINEERSATINHNL